MFPQYAERQNGGEIAIWLLLTVGALLIPIIIIAVCCIRRHFLTRPNLKLMENRHSRTMTTMKQGEPLRSYNGPYVESGNDDADVSSENYTNLTFSRNNSLKKQHVHWPDGSTTPKIDIFHSIKEQQFASQKKLFPENILNTTMLTESPSTHRRFGNTSVPSAALSHFIQTAIIPAGSTVESTGTSDLLAPSKQFTSTTADYHNIV